MNDLFARAGTPLYNRIGSNTVLPQKSSFRRKHSRVQQFSKRHFEGLVSDSHQHPCASSESTRSTHKDKSFSSRESSPSFDGSHSQQRTFPQC